MTTIERTQRWRTAFVFVLVTSSAGVYLERPLLLLASIVGIAYTAYPLLLPTPTVDLALSRTVTEESPAHGESVTVTVTVTNTGSRTLPDVRLIDGVPTYLTVTDGAARHTATLRPEASTTFQYTVDAKNGVHHFEPATAIIHDISGGTRIRTEIETGTETAVTETLDCSVEISTLRSRRQTQQQTGRTVADVSGAGVEFYQTRAYRPGDPSNRIDWRRFARTGELTTIEFREERLRTVILCLDARASAVRRKRPDDPHAVAYSSAVATEVLSALLDQGERVGVAVFGDEFSWLAPNTGSQHQAQASHLLRMHRGRSSAQQDSTQAATPHSEQIRKFLVQSEDTVEVILFSPLLDDFGVTAAERFEANGHSVTVISPDVTTPEALGGELTQIERRNRMQSVRNAQVPVCDWTPGDPIIWPGDERRGK